MTAQTIYVELMGEGVDVWRPVEATLKADGSFLLPDRAPEGETWRFPPGSIVRCETRKLFNREELVASERVR